MKRKMIAFLCILSMCMSLVTPAMAADINKSEEINHTYSASDYWINPLYEDVISSSEYAQDSHVTSARTYAVENTSLEQYVSTIEEAAIVLRNGLVNRESSISVYYQLPAEGIPFDDEIAFNEWFSLLGNSILELSMEHTGVPYEGDSLRCEVGAGRFGSSSITVSDGYCKVPITYTMTFYTTTEQEKELNTAIDGLIQTFDLDGKSDYKKICLIYDYICQNIVYDYDNLEDDDYKLKYTAYAALINKSAVCQGYADLFYRLALTAGVDTRVICGNATNSSNNTGRHAWNIVAIDDIYYNLDSTWDHAWYEAGLDYNYFLVGSNNFDDHISDSEYLTEKFTMTYPISKTDYQSNNETMPDTSMISLFINEPEGAKFIDQNGNNLTDVLTSGDEENEYLVSSGTILKFKIKLEDNYEQRFESFQNDNGDLGLGADEEGYYYVKISDSTYYKFQVFTEKVLWYERVYETYFSALGLLHADTQKYIPANEDVEPSAALWFLKQIDAFSDFLNEDYDVEISYTEFMNIVSAHFVNPPDMKSYMIEKEYYNESDDKVEFYSGNSFGSEDLLVWNVLSTSESENEVTVTGLYLCGVCEDITNLNCNTDYYNYYDPDSCEYVPLFIEDIVEMTLVKDETNVKIASYEQADYYIIDNTLYAYNEDRTELSAYNKIEVFEGIGTEFEFEDTYTFDGNESLWYKASEGFSWKCNVAEGYQASVYIESEKEEGANVSSLSGIIDANSGIVTLTIGSMAEVTVDASNATVLIENLDEKDGVYLLPECTAVSFTVTPDEGYTVTSVKANGSDVNYLESFGKYSLYPDFGPIEIVVTTEKTEPDIPVVEPDTTLPVAVIAPEDIIGTTGEEITFSGINSTDNAAIASYKWDFGDGTVQTGSICKHTYTKGGTYTVTLTVTDTSGNKATVTKEVFVYGITGEDAEYALMTIKTIDGYTEGTPVIGNVNVQITSTTEDDNFETMVLTDENGIATVVVPRTSITIAAIADGYSATSRVVNVEPDEKGKFSHTLSLSPAGISLVDGSVTVEPMTLDEIKDAGIEINNPENQQIVRTELQIRYGSDIGSSFDIGIYSDDKGNILGGFNIGEWITVNSTKEDDDTNDDSEEGGSSGSSGGSSGSGGSGGYSSSGGGRKFLVLTLSEKMFLVIHGETHWLKEMYNVDLIVLNNSRVEDLTDCVAELELPNGLSLAKMIDKQQSATVDLGTIEKYSDETGYNSTTYTWYVCGDEMGEYNITANVSGNAVNTDDGSTSAFDVSFTTTNPVKVYAGDALYLTIRPQDVCYYGEKYYVNYSLKNVSDITLYNLTLAFTFTEQYQLARMTDGTEEYKYIDNELFGDEMYIEVEEFEPGQVIEFMFCTETWFEDEFMEGAASIIPLTDAEYRYRDAFLTFAESSTTTIPYTIDLWEVEKDGFWEWIDGECREWEEDLLGNMTEDFFVTLIDSRLCKKIPVAKYGVKVMKYVIGENTHHDIESEMVVTPGDGVEIVESGDAVRQQSTYANTLAETNTDTLNSDTNVIVYTDVPYEMSEDGKSMIISQDATLYIARVDEGEANLSVTTCYYPYGTAKKDTYTQETIRYELISDPDEEYSELLSEAVDVELEPLEASEFDIPYNDTSTVELSALYMDADGYYHLAASNAQWSVEGEDTEGLEIVDGTLYISPSAKEGNYTVRVSLEDTEVVKTQTITLKKTDCVHSYTKYTVVDNPTCTADGSKIATCDNGCGTTDIQVIEATGHNKVVDNAVKATCTKTGLSEGSHCSVCNEVLVSQKKISATGHSYGAYKTTTKATFGKAGVQTAKCSKCSSKKTKSIAAVKTPTLSTTEYTYNNKTKTPSVTVKDSKGTKLSKVTSTSKNGYMVSYGSGRKKVGKYAVTVTLTGPNYSGKKTLYFKINPKGVSVSKLSKAKKAFTVKWKKPSSTYRKQMTGYQIRYSTSSKMKSAKTVTVKSTTATSKKISKLKAKKTYYVQLRTYKKVGSTTYYSGWSTAKKVKTK